jgi:hypothetical protein
MPVYSGSTYTGSSTAFLGDIYTYSATSDVADLCRSLLGPESDFSGNTVPSASAVVNWLADGYSIINAQLASVGFATPAASTAGIYQHLKHLNTLYAAGFAELSRVNTTVGPGERTRGQVFLDMFWKQCDKLEEYASSGDAGGLETDTGIGSIYAGGTSVATKATYESNTDRVVPRFTRNMFRFPGV